MKTYTLYLDEILPGDNLKFFCLAGVIINDDTYTNKIIPEINTIKNSVFDCETVVLHEADIRKPKNDTVYMKVKGKVERENYFSLISNFFKTNDFHVLGAALQVENARYLYKDHRDRYFICLQIILENFAHFLKANNAKGKILMEARNRTQDEKLKKHFNNLRCSTGTLFYRPVDISECIDSITFPAKISNNIGLQIADMIPNPLNRKLSGMKQVVPGLLNEIEKKVYDGNLGNSDRFGIKIITKNK